MFNESQAIGEGLPVRANGIAGLSWWYAGHSYAGQYFSTACEKREAHWPKGQVVANLFRGSVAGPSSSASSRNSILLRVD
jgi:hypothetical protein